jgi:hypothetical protein
MSRRPCVFTQVFGRVSDRIQENIATIHRGCGRPAGKRIQCNLLRNFTKDYKGRERAVSVRKGMWKSRTGGEKEAWIVDYVDQDGSRHIQTFDRKKDADAYHATVR